MKKLLMVLAGASFLLVACGNKKECEKECNKECGENATKTEVVETTSTFEGTYEGTFPCADCSGIATKVVLNADGTFAKRQEYLEKEDAVFETKGVYTFDAEKNEVCLENENGEKEMFLLNNGALQLLDKDGNTTDAYTLTKK